MRKASAHEACGAPLTHAYGHKAWRSTYLFIHLVRMKGRAIPALARGTSQAMWGACVTHHMVATQITLRQVQGSI